MFVVSSCLVFAIVNSMTSKEGLLGNYPNFGSNHLPLLIGCVPEEEIDDAKNFFLRSCFKGMTIQDVMPLKRNFQPSCAWRVCYKLRDRTPNFVEPGKSSEDFFIPLPDSDEELKKLFNQITAMVVGMSVAQKNCTYDKVFAIVDYVPIHCTYICPVQDFNVTTKVPRMRSSITEVSMNFYDMKL
ncbi:uncharacterized protein BDFB_012132 [Asbolus verrucosus]|uniref:Uncharacterized protein n=1 Tax=Asbolus verrucosus TaxID=1661398 RepID=A0A482VGI5_ASBVE|nr:uncharacterized protein BDFB_012132 [Asbolus verrucosus]